MSIRCSPMWNPLSEGKRMWARPSCPVFCRASTSVASRSSTANRERSRTRYCSLMRVICSGLSSGRSCTQAGLSLTSASLKEGGRGAGVLGEGLGWGAAGGGGGGGGQKNEDRRPVPGGPPDDVRRLSRQDVGQVVLRRVPILD